MYVWVHKLFQYINNILLIKFLKYSKKKNFQLYLFLKTNIFDKIH